MKHIISYETIDPRTKERVTLQEEIEGDSITYGKLGDWSLVLQYFWWHRHTELPARECQIVGLFPKKGCPSLKSAQTMEFFRMWINFNPHQRIQEGRQGPEVQHRHPGYEYWHSKSRAHIQPIKLRTKSGKANW